jgi:hypothetical protein
VKSATARRQEWASFALGLWLAVSPWVCGYADTEPAATGNAAFMGVALALASHFLVSLEGQHGDWVNFGAGVWLAAAPFVLGFAHLPVPAINSIVVGTMVMAFAASALSLDKEIEKWWHKHFSRTEI